MIYIPFSNRMSPSETIVALTFGLLTCFKPSRRRHWRIASRDGFPVLRPNAAEQKSASAWSEKKQSAGRRDLYDCPSHQFSTRKQATGSQPGRVQSTAGGLCLDWSALPSRIKNRTSFRIAALWIIPGAIMTDLDFAASLMTNFFSSIHTSPKATSESLPFGFSRSPQARIMRRVRA